MVDNELTQLVTVTTVVEVTKVGAYTNATDLKRSCAVADADIS